MANLRFGRYHFGRYIFAGTVATSGTVTISYPLQTSGYAVKFYNAGGIKVKEFSSEMQDTPVLEIQFTLEQTGCADFAIAFGSYQDFIVYNMRVDIHLLGDANPWFSGFITKRPKLGTSAETYEYDGSGFYDKLNDVIINRSYENTELSAMVKAIAKQDLAAKTKVLYNGSKIYTTAYTASKMQFKYQAAIDAIGDLADMAANYNYGVDAQRELFFRPISSDVLYTFVQDYHFQNFEPEDNVKNLANHIYVKASSAYVTALSEAADSSSTSLKVKSAIRILAGDILTLDDEQVYVSAISGTTLTVTRAYNDSTAAAHESGTLLQNNYETTLNSSADSATTTIEVVKSNWITAGDILTIDSEQVCVKSTSGKILSIARGYNRTTPASHDKGATVTNKTQSSTSNKILYECSDSDSINNYGLFEAVKSIPSTMSADDAQRWGDYQLQKYKDAVVTGTLENVEVTGKIDVYGKCRIICHDGTEYSLAIVKVAYSVSSKGITCSITVGALAADDLDIFIAKLVREQKNQEYLQNEEEN